MEGWRSRKWSLHPMDPGGQRQGRTSTCGWGGVLSTWPGNCHNCLKDDRDRGGSGPSIPDSLDALQRWSSLPILCGEYKGRGSSSMCSSSGCSIRGSQAWNHHSAQAQLSSSESSSDTCETCSNRSSCCSICPTTCLLCFHTSSSCCAT